MVDAEAGAGMLTCLAPDSSFQIMDLPSLLPLIAEVSPLVIPRAPMFPAGCNRVDGVCVCVCAFIN